MQRLVRHDLNFLLPLGCNINNTVAKIKKCLVVQLLQRSMTVVEELGKDAHHRLFQIEDGAEVEELHQQIALVLLLEHWQLLNATLGLVLLLRDV